MKNKVRAILHTPEVRAAIAKAWQDSQPGIAGGHEEGGFITEDNSGNLKVIRWSRGEQDSIIVPLHQDCRFDGQDILATFHTHPNTGMDYLQEPGETDKRAVRDDPALKGRLYEGEFVISASYIYLILPTGQVVQLASSKNDLETG